ncbi:hypothetical protein DPEC_G00140050, partial [Dallia pectoralis]
PFTDIYSDSNASYSISNISISFQTVYNRRHFTNLSKGQMMYINNEAKSEFAALDQHNPLKIHKDAEHTGNEMQQKKEHLINAFCCYNPQSFLIHTHKWYY